MLKGVRARLWALLENWKQDLADRIGWPRMLRGVRAQLWALLEDWKQDLADRTCSAGFTRRLERDLADSWLAEDAKGGKSAAVGSTRRLEAGSG